MCQDTHRLSEPAEADPLLEKGLALLGLPMGHVSGATWTQAGCEGGDSPSPSMGCSQSLSQCHEASTGHSHAL